MATIVRTLECDQRRLSMLHLEGLPNAVDIVCYEKEKIQSVTEEWMMSCGARRLHYNAPPRSCVLSDHEVPERALSIWPQLSPEQLLHPPPGGNVLAYDSHHSVA